MLVGRERDLAFLKNAYEGPGGQLLVLYGQRRVGKTALLKAFSQGIPHLYYRPASCSDPLQRTFFYERLLQWSLSQGIREEELHKKVKGEPDSGQEGKKDPPTWRQLLEGFASLPLRGRKALLLLDDLPLLLSPGGKMASQEEDFLTALLSLWKERLCQRQLCIVLSGSDEAFFEKRLLEGTQSLYGNATGVRKLNPLRVPMTGAFLPEACALERFQAAAILGGVPAYLSCLDPALSLSENLQRELLSPRGRLSNEVPLLLREALREPGQYQSILYAIASGAHSLSEITKTAALQSSAKCAVYLKTLEELSLVEKQVSLPATGDTGLEKEETTEENENKNGKARGEEEHKKKAHQPSQTKGGPGRYRITSPLFRFWYALIFPHLSLLDVGETKILYDTYVNPGLPAIYSLALEEEALAYLKEAGKRGALPFQPALIGPWFGKTTLLKGEKTILAKTSIPVLAYNQDRTRAIVAACSYGEGFTYARYLQERTKLLPLQAQTQISYYLFSTQGFDPRLTALEKESPFVTLVPLEELLKAPQGKEEPWKGREQTLLPSFH